MPQLTDSAVLEIARLQAEAAQLIQLPNLTQSDRKKADLLISQISSIRSLGVSTDEIRQLATARDPQLKKAEAARVAQERAFRAYLCLRPDEEIRDIEAWNANHFVDTRTTWRLPRANQLRQRGCGRLSPIRPAFQSKRGDLDSGKRLPVAPA